VNPEFKYGPPDSFAVFGQQIQLGASNLPAEFIKEISISNQRLVDYLNRDSGSNYPRAQNELKQLPFGSAQYDCDEV
jgi:hypothetical protein